MKKHMVIICGIYYPEPTATGLCAKRYISLLKDYFDIELLCISKTGTSQTLSVNIEGSNKEMVIHCLGRRKDSLKKGILKPVMYLHNGFELKTKILGNLDWYKKEAYRELENIHNNKKIDVIFSICSPMAAHCAAAQMKTTHPDIRCVAFTVDPYSSTNRIHSFGNGHAKLVEFENMTLRKFDSVLLSEEIFNHRKDLFNDINNCLPLQYMLPDFDSDIFDDGYINQTGAINCVYAGSLFKDVRNPEYLLKVFETLKDEKIYLHLYSFGCEKIIKKYADALPNIKIHNCVSYNEIRGIYHTADFLIGIGNNTNEIFPSKTFEYIVAQKPIIYVNHDKLDNAVLRNHPQALQISDNDNIESSASRVKMFCTENKNSYIPKEQLVDIYKKHSKETILEILLKICR